MLPNKAIIVTLFIGISIAFSGKSQELMSLDEFKFTTSSKISSKLLMQYGQHFTVHFKITPLHLGPSNGKGLRLDYTSKGDYLFIALDDDKPFAIYDSQLKGTAEGAQMSVEIGEVYDFTINITSNGIEAIVIDEDGNRSLLRYEKELGSNITAYLQCQRSGALFEDVRLKVL